MGFRMNLGATRACRFYDGYLEVEGPCPRRFQTTVKINTEWQCNIFEGDRLFFLILADDNLYIGLRDGGINMCGSDGLLKALYTWQAPELKVLTVVGYHNNAGLIEEAKVDWEEPQLIHIDNTRTTYVLNEGLTVLAMDLDDEAIDDRLSICLKGALNKRCGLVAMLRGGDLVEETEQGNWRSDPYLSTIPFIQF